MEMESEEYVNRKSRKQRRRRLVYSSIILLAIVGIAMECKDADTYIVLEAEMFMNKFVYQICSTNFTDFAVDGIVVIYDLLYQGTHDLL